MMGLNFSENGFIHDLIFLYSEQLVKKWIVDKNLSLLQQDSHVTMHYIYLNIMALCQIFCNETELEKEESHISIRYYLGKITLIIHFYSVE